MNTGRKKMMLYTLPLAFVSLLVMGYTMREANYGDDDDQDEAHK